MANESILIRIADALETIASSLVKANRKPPARSFAVEILSDKEMSWKNGRGRTVRIRSDQRMVAPDGNAFHYANLLINEATSTIPLPKGTKARVIPWKISSEKKEGKIYYSVFAQEIKILPKEDDDADQGMVDEPIDFGGTPADDDTIPF